MLSGLKRPFFESINQIHKHGCCIFVRLRKMRQRASLLSIHYLLDGKGDSGQSGIRFVHLLSNTIDDPYIRSYRLRIINRTQIKTWWYLCCVNKMSTSRPKQKWTSTSALWNFIYATYGQYRSQTKNFQICLTHMTMIIFCIWCMDMWRPLHYNENTLMLSMHSISWNLLFFFFRS